MKTVLILLLSAGGARLLAESGTVKSDGQPIPGATVTVVQGDRTFSTVTGTNGEYHFQSLGPGTWSVSVEMFGFNTLTRNVNYDAVKKPVDFELELKPSPVLQRLQAFEQRRTQMAGPGGESGPAATASNQQIDQVLQNELNSQQQSVSVSSNGSQASNETFLVSGSLSPGMAQGSQADSGPDLRFERGMNALGTPGGMEGTPKDRKSVV